MPDRLSSSRLSGSGDNPLDVVRQAIAYNVAERRDVLQRDGRAAQRATVTKMHPRRPEFPLLLRVEQACQLLGISRSAGYRAATAGDLPILRLGRRVYVPTAPLLAMLGLVAEERQ
jgi:excisionase family DNA binding protein